MCPAKIDEYVSTRHKFWVVRDAYEYSSGETKAKGTNLVQMSSGCDVVACDVNTQKFHIVEIDTAGKRENMLPANI